MTPPKAAAIIPPELSPYVEINPKAWGALGADAQMTLTEEELRGLRGINSPISMEEVSRIYLPISRLLRMYVSATQELYTATSRFLGHPAERVPYVIGLAGSVAVGKSTSARILQTLLAGWANAPRVDLLTTDGFLYPNDVLAERGLMHRKGFPESYDLGKLLRFVSDIKAGAPSVACPVYSHVTYDIIPDAEQVIEHPDVVIVEGLNILQSHTHTADASRVFVSDFFDFTIYLDADEPLLRRWYIRRFLLLRDTAFRDPSSYFHRYAHLSDAQAIELATEIWETINLKNLHENVLPTRDRADLILRKGDDHTIDRIRLRKL